MAAQLYQICQFGAVGQALQLHIRIQKRTDKEPERSVNLFSFLFWKLKLRNRKAGCRMSSALLISDAAKRVKVEAHVLRYWEEELGLPIKRNELGHRYYTEEDVKRFQEIKDLKERGLQLKAIRMVLKNGKLDMITPAAVPEAEEEKLRKSAETIKEFPSMKQTELLKEIKKAESGQGIKKAEINEGQQERGKIQVVKGGRTEQEEAAKTPELKRVTGEAEVVKDVPAVEKKQDKPLPAEQKKSLQRESNEEKFKRLQWLLKQLFKETLQENNEYLCRDMKESVLKEMDYQFRMQEEREEERNTEKVKREEEHYKKIDELLRKKRRLLRK